MTEAESTHSTPDLEALVNEYEAGAANTSEAASLAFLEARSTIEGEREQLTTAQTERVKKADQKLMGNAGAVALKLEEAGKPLADARAAGHHSADEWWWHLDVLDSVADYYSGKPQSRTEQTLSRIVDALLLVALVGLGFLLVSRYLPPLQGNSSTPVLTLVPTVPTSTPSITPTINSAAFDYSTAKVFKAGNDAVEINLPTGWDSMPNNGTPFSANQWSFGFGDPAAPQASILIFLDTRAQVISTYQKFFGVTFVSPTGAKDVLTQSVAQLKGKIPTDGSIILDDPRSVKLSNATEAYGMAAHFKDNPTSGQSASDSEYWLGFLPDGTGIVVITQIQHGVVDKAQPTVYKMLETLVININKIPTATPTATLHPLLLTATMLQTQINALTPTSTPTPAATGAATGVATTSGTENVGPATLSPATAVSTPAQ